VQSSAVAGGEAGRPRLSEEGNERLLVARSLASDPEPETGVGRIFFLPSFSGLFPAWAVRALELSDPVGSIEPVIE